MNAVTGESALALDLTWAALHAHVAAMADRISADGPPSVVVGVLRGGMVPAVALAHQLGVRDVRAIGVEHTRAEGTNAAKHHAPRVLNPASLGVFEPGSDVLVVDDVAGSGASLAAASALLPRTVARVRHAVVVVNTINWTKANTIAPQEYCQYIGTTCAGWVRFPWEAR
ncbi:phosphoribosyltransferase [Nocardia asiatica]|uniref:phosphoribosyltransferase n=1 Tax=Nocardia asiatica TaxID=209252 RepID=UPI0024558B49|nr:phosphoribosyltransferase family protein [Nocardia asiatica]